MEKKNRSLPRAADIVLFASVIAAALILMFALGRGESSALTAVVTLDGRVIERVELSSLAEPRRIPVEGEFEAVVVIARDGAYIEESSCPNLDCVASGRIDRAGQSLVCLPNRLTVTLEGSGADVDAYTG